MEFFCSKKQWILPAYQLEDIRLLCSELKISEIPAMLLINRGIKHPSDARWFMNTEDLYLYDPFLMKDMDKAVDRINRAVAEKEKICIYGDYDVDGISATAVMYNYLVSKHADVMYYIPQRLSEGYGMNNAAIEKLSNDGVNLIITVDNGITANEEIEYAKKLGIDVVVTDHHECLSEIPDCCAVVNPKRPDDTYPFGNLAGVGVAFKVVCALESGTNDEAFCEKYIDLAALGTISDVMPLCDENRQIVARGLKCLKKGSSIGIVALVEQATCERNKSFDRNFTTSTIGFTVAPRLNAAGRIGNVERAVELLITNNYEKCLSIADELCTKNRERQFVENKIYNEAVEIIEHEHDFDNDKVIVVSCNDWHHGVVGIVASRITEKYGLPSILISREGGIGKGSARSIKGFNINEAIHTCKDLLIKHGGHELAAGLTIELDNISEFRKRINSIVCEKITDEVCEIPLEIDAEISGEDISLEVCEEISALEPYGTANPTPVFYIRNAQVLDVISLGQNKHTKLSLRKDNRVFEGLIFGSCPDDFTVPGSGLVDIAFTLDVNEFRGMRNPQLIIKDIRFCKDDARAVASNIEVMHRILEGRYPEYAPDIPLCRSVYIYLRNNSERLEGYVNLYVLSQKIAERMNVKLFAPILGVILEIFSEMNLCELVKKDDFIMRIKLSNANSKVNLEESKVLLRARNAI